MPIEEAHLLPAEVLAGNSMAVEHLRRQVARFAPHYRALLLVGEAGVGKRAVARELHRLSGVSQGSFVEIGASALLDGPIAPAATLSLRGMEGLAPESQGALLQALDRLPRETRLIVACEGDPRGMIAAGRLRGDLYERVGMLEMRVPPLRERGDDLAAIAANMLSRLAAAAFASDALERLQQHRWEGNLAELWTVCSLFAAGHGLQLKASPTVEPEDLRLDEVMHRHVMDVLERCAGNKLRAAEMLGISRSTLYRMLV